jgi:DNA-binding transcriptional ArsR family regulator
MLNNDRGCQRAIPAATVAAVMTPARKPARRGPAALQAERRRITGELRALAHPIRLKLLEYFAEPRTTMQVAALMGEPPTRLYHHVNALERAGILRLKNTKQVRGTTEKYYEIAKRQIGIASPKHAPPSSRAALSGLASMVFEEGRQELLASIAKADKLTPDTAPIAFRMLISVPAGQQATIRKRIQGMIKGLKADFEDCEDAGVQTWAMTLGFAPTLSKKRPT